MMHPLIRHCERSEAIQSGGWIAASPSAPRNDGKKSDG